jgi:hypothetical protein
MTLTLTPEEHEFLLETLTSYLSGLHREIARTDSRSFKTRLRVQEEIAHTLIERLRSAPASLDTS